MTRFVPYLAEEAIEHDAEALLAEYAQSRGIVVAPPIPIEEIVEKHLKLRVEFDDTHKLFGIPRESQRDADILGAVFFDERRIVIDESLDPRAGEQDRCADLAEKLGPADLPYEAKRRVEPGIGRLIDAQLGARRKPAILQPATFGIARRAADFGRGDAIGTPRARSGDETEAETRGASSAGDAACDRPRNAPGTDPEHWRRQNRRVEEARGLPQADQRDRASHRVADQQTRMTRRRQFLRELRQVIRVAIVAARARPARPAPRALGAPLPAPIETPYRQATGREVGRRLEIFFDALGEATDHHAFDTGIGRRQMAPTQPCPVGRGKTAPNKTVRLEEARRQLRTPGCLLGRPPRARLVHLSVRRFNKFCRRHQST